MSKIINAHLNSIFHFFQSSASRTPVDSSVFDIWEGSDNFSQCCFFLFYFPINIPLCFHCVFCLLLETNNLLYWHMQSHQQMIKLICVCLLGEITHYPFLGADNTDTHWHGVEKKGNHLFMFKIVTWWKGLTFYTDQNRYSCFQKLFHTVSISRLVTSFFCIHMVLMSFATTSLCEVVFQVLLVKGSAFFTLMLTFHWEECHRPSRFSSSLISLDVFLMILNADMENTDI